MDRRHVITGLITAGLVLGGYLWWSTGRTTFEPSYRTEVTIAGEVYEVKDWIGVDAPGAPERARACFRISGEITAPPELEPRPTPGPDWLRCFSVEFIEEALASGSAVAYVAERDDPRPGWNRVVAIVPGRRVYMWHERQD